MSPPSPRPEIFSIAPYAPGESKLPGIDQPLKLSSNEGAFGPPPAALRAAADVTAEMHRYPESSSARLRQAIGERFGLDPERIVCGNGSDELIALLIQSFGGPGTELIMTRHGFSIYDIIGKLCGCTVIKVPETSLTADIDRILAAVTPKTRMVFIANPNNPTGTMVSDTEIQRLRDGLPKDVLLVIDAAYAEYVTHKDYDPGASLVDAGDNTVMTRTFSKIFGLGGARLGWAYGPANIIDILNRVRPPFPVNVIATAAGLGALSEPGWIEKGQAHNINAKQRLMDRLVQAGLTVYPSEANFILVDFLNEDKADEADKFLRAQGIIVRRLVSYELPTCLRITIGTDPECDRVALALVNFTHD